MSLKASLTDSRNFTVRFYHPFFGRCFKRKLMLDQHSPNSLNSLNSYILRPSNQNHKIPNQNLQQFVNLSSKPNNSLNISQKMLDYPLTNDKKLCLNQHRGLNHFNLRFRHSVLHISRIYIFILVFKNLLI